MSRIAMSGESNQIQVPPRQSPPNPMLGSIINGTTARLKIFVICKARLCLAAIVIVGFLSMQPLNVLAGEEDDLPILDPSETRVSDWIERDPIIGSTFHGDSELGFSQTQGNDDTRSLLAKGRLHNEREFWRHTARAEANFEEDEGEDTTEQYLVLQKSAYKITGNDYIFEQLKYEKDRSLGYRYRYVEVVGYGRRVLSTRSMTLDLEAGPGLRQTLPNTGNQNEERLAVFTGELDWEITPSSHFNEYLTVEAGDDNTVTQSLTTLTIQLDNALSARISYDVENNSNVADGVENTDTEASITLVYSF